MVFHIFDLSGLEQAAFFHNLCQMKEALPLNSLFSFLRAFSRRLELREAENQVWLRYLEKKKAARAAAKNRRAQKDYRFFKCPNCGTWVRVPRGKGKVHINCKCGYILYRKT